MKKEIFIIVALCFAFLWVNGQSFSNKTNAIKLDYTAPVKPTVVPQIIWTTPKAESSVSGEESITIEASISSDIPLKEVKLIITNAGESREKKIPIKESERIV